jgi:hypothetical protein
MTIIPLKEKSCRYWYFVLIPVLGIVFFFIAFRIVNTIDYHNSDFFTFWLAGHLATSGQNPYLADIWVGGHHQFGVSWIPNATFIYPLPVSLLFAPLGLLSFHDAFVVWDFLTQVMISFSVFLLLRRYPAALTKHYVMPIIAGIIIFRPTIITLVNGQLAGFLLIVITAIICLWEKGKWWQGAVLLPILALKPNLGVPIIVFLSFYLLMQKKYTPLIAGGISGLVIVIAGVIQNPNWISEFLRAGNLKLSQTFGFSPTVWGISTFLCNYTRNCSISFGGVLSLFFLTTFIFLLARKRRVISPALVTSLAISTMLLTTPYTWVYDQLLLIAPIITVTMSIGKAGYRFLPTALIFVGIDIMEFIILGISVRIQLDIWNVMIPFSVLSLLVWFLFQSNPDPQTMRAV